MGIRLVKYGINGNSAHDILTHRDYPNQHPIEAITGLKEALANVQPKIKNTNSIDLDINTNNELSANVRILKSISNALEIKENALYVDKYHMIDVEDTYSGHLFYDGYGETLKEIFDNHELIVFDGNKDISNTINGNYGWIFDDTINSFIQTTNSSCFNGFVAKSRYRSYTHIVKIKSSGSDNDINGLIIGCFKDENGDNHTLSFIIDKGGSRNITDFNFGIVYDFGTNNSETLIDDKSANYIPRNFNNINENMWGPNWNNAYIVVKIVKLGNIINCYLSDWNNDAIIEDTKLSVNLSDYDWGINFEGLTKYGYCNYSQTGSSYEVISFEGMGALKCDVKISSFPDNGLIIKEDGLYCNGSGGGNSSGVKNNLTITQQNHKFNIGDVLYCKSNGLYDKALAENSEKVEAIGIVSDIEDEDNFSLTLSGLFETDLFDNYSLGSVLYLTEDINNPGTLADTINMVYKPIGIKLKEGILINIQRGNIQSSNPSESTDTGGTTTVRVEYYTDEEILEIIEDVWN